VWWFNDPGCGDFPVAFFDLPRGLMLDVSLWRKPRAKKGRLRSNARTTCRCSMP
jgi:hypothetical protein